MSELKKVSVDALSKKLFQNNTNVLIENDLTKKQELINEISTYINNECSNLFSINNQTIESLITLYESKFDTFLTEEFQKKNQNWLFAKETLLSQYKDKHGYSKYKVFKENKVTSFILNKYRPTNDISKDKILSKINISNKNSSMYFCIFYNKEDELCIDFTSFNPKDYYYMNNIEAKLPVISYKTNYESLKLFFDGLKKVEFETRNKKAKRDKINNLISKGVIGNIKEILDNYNCEYEIIENRISFEITLKIRNGNFFIKIFKKNIKTKLSFLNEFISTIEKAYELGIECRFKRSHS